MGMNFDQDISVDNMSFKDTEERDFVMRQVKNIFKANSQENKKKTAQWRIFGITYNEFRHSSINPRRSNAVIVNAGDPMEGKQVDMEIKELACSSRPQCPAEDEQFND